MRSLPLMMFAAGFGTRMQPLTNDMPKPLIKVAGKPLLDHALAMGRDAGCEPVVANLHYRADQLERHLAGTGVRTSLEHPVVLDTGGGLRQALPLLGEGPVVTSNTDAVWSGPNAIKMLLDAWDPDSMDALLLTVPLAQTVGRKGVGDFTMNADGRLTRGPDVVYSGIQILKTDLLLKVAEPAFSLNVIWDQMQAKGRLFGLAYPGRWCDVGHPAGIGLAENMLAQTDD